jgi:hypothetical protein
MNKSSSVLVQEYALSPFETYVHPLLILSTVMSW